MKTNCFGNQPWVLAHTRELRSRGPEMFTGPSWRLFAGGCQHSAISLAPAPWKRSSPAGRQVVG
jgi:hypothetical protein